MEKLSTGLTWGQLESHFLTDPDFEVVLNYTARRASQRLRKNGLANEKKVWRFIFQRNTPWKMTTLYRKNLKDVPEDLSESVVPDAILERLNMLMEMPWRI